MPVATIAAPSDAGTLIHRRLRAVRRRCWAHFFAFALGVTLPVFACVALLWGVYCFFAGRPVCNEITLVILVWLPLATSLFVTFGLNASVLSLGKAARWIDWTGETHDRFWTAFTLVNRPAASRTPMEELALAECTRFIGAFDRRRAIPIPWNIRLWLATLAPLLALAMLALHATLGIGQPPRDPALDAAVNRRADTLEKIADRLRRDPQTNQPELDKIADEMKRSAERLKAGERQTDADRLKSALKEISSLEAMLNAMKQVRQDGKISPGELSALAAALAASEQSRDAAESLKSGRLEQAAGQLEQLLQQLKEQGNASQALQQLAQSMQEQAAKLAEQEKNEVARQMQQAVQGAQSGQPQLSQQALRRLADLLRRAGQNGQSKNGSSQQQAANGKGGQPMTEKQLQDLINSLENMKDGLRPGDGEGKSSGQPQDGQGDGQGSLAMVESFGQNPSGNPGQNPSGLPGSERDTGHPDKLYGEKPSEAVKQGEAKRLEGLLGEGESLQELTSAGGGSPAKAGRRYKELYDAMAPAAQETVEQENIPLGSRFYIKRYFENIRPKE